MVGGVGRWVFVGSCDTGSRCVWCRYYAVFDLLIADCNPKVYKHLRKHSVPHNLYLFRWLQTMYLKVLPLDAAARVWDIFLLEGVVVLFKVAVALLTLLQPALFAGGDDATERTYVATPATRALQVPCRCLAAGVRALGVRS